MSELPAGWKIEPLGKLAQIVSGGTPSRVISEFWVGGKIPWVTPSDITRTRGRFLDDATECVTELGIQSSSAKRLPPGSLLMTSRATLGEIRIANVEVCTNQGFKSLIPNKDVHGAFLFYQLTQNKERYKVFGIGSTFLEVNKRDTENFELLVPPLPQQRRIAEILGTVDEVIEQTEALIAKQQQVKAGLMHDLFTRGVTATGQLRPPPAEAPHLYQASPLGPIPKEWEPHQIDAIGEVITGNTPAETSLETGSRGIPFVTPGDVGDDIFVRATERSLTNRLAERARLIPANSVCVVCIGSTIGKLAMVACESVTNQQINSVVCRETALASFVYFSMRHFLPSQLRREAGLQAVPIVNKSTFSRLLIAKPREPREAKTIQTRLLSAAEGIAAETAHLAKLRQQKQGLMHDLLTARVPV